MDRPTRSAQMGYGPTVQQLKSWAVQISKLSNDGQITEWRIHIYRFDDEKRQCYDLGGFTACKSSPQSTPRFTIYSTRKSQYQLALLSR